MEAGVPYSRSIPAGPGAEIMRRVLLGMVTALLVARPLVAGEDPGRTQLGTGVAGLGLVLLWLLTALGWGIWRAWSGEGAWRGSLVEVGLLLLVGVSFYSADQTGRYWYPGWLISWEWVGVFTAFCLVRQLFRKEEDNDGLLAALMATGIALAATALIQAITQVPGTSAKPDPLIARIFGIEEAPPDVPAPWFESIRGPFAQPAGLAGFLALILPALLMASTVLKRTRRGWDYQVLLWGGLGIFVIAGAAQESIVFVVLPLFLLAAVLGGLGLRRDWTVERAFRWVAVYLACFWLGYIFLFPQLFHEGFDPRLGAWSATSTLIREHPWFGVGPGNFGRDYPAFLTSAAQLKIAEPPNFLLEIAANYGLIGLAVLVTTIALFFWRIAPAFSSTPIIAGGGRKPPEGEDKETGRPGDPDTPNEEDKETERQGDTDTPKHSTTEEEEPSVSASPCLPVSLSSPSVSPRPPVSLSPLPQARSPRTMWEFYLGGMAGLTLGFMLRFDPAGGSRALAVEAIAALIRFVIWFGAFALLERVPWTNRARLAGASMGVAALLVYLLFNSGFGFPSLAVPLWAMAALALNATPSSAFQPRHWISRVLPAPLLGVLCFLFLVMVLYPAASAASSVKEARKAYSVWRDRAEPRWKQKLEETNSTPEEKLKAAHQADRFLKQRILAPLERARELDRFNAALCTEAAYWYAKEWQLFAGIREFENNKVMALTRDRQRKMANQAIGAIRGGYRPDSGAHGAWELDPNGPESWWGFYQVRTLFAEGAEKAKDRADQNRMAANNLAELVKRDPTDPRLRLLLAETLFKTRQKDDDTEGRKQLQEAQRLDAEAGDGPRRLSDVQRANLDLLLGKPGD